MMKTLKIYSFGSAFLLSCLLSTSLSAPTRADAAERIENRQRVYNAIATVADHIDNPIDRAEDFIGNYTPQEKEKRNNAVRDLVAMALEESFQNQLKNAIYSSLGNPEITNARQFEQAFNESCWYITDHCVARCKRIFTEDKNSCDVKAHEIAFFKSELSVLATGRRQQFEEAKGVAENEDLWGDFTKITEKTQQNIEKCQAFLTTHASFTRAYIDDQFAQQLAGTNIRPKLQQHLDNAKQGLLTKISAQTPLKDSCQRLLHEETQRLTALEKGKQEALEKAKMEMSNALTKLLNQCTQPAIGSISWHINNLFSPPPSSNYDSSSEGKSSSRAPSYFASSSSSEAPSPAASNASREAPSPLASDASIETPPSASGDTSSDSDFEHV